jgi:peroxiredoxin Q/BCP
LQSRIADFEGVDAAILGVSVDEAEHSREIVEAYGLEFPILSDPELRMIDAFGVRHEAGGMGGVDIARPAVFVLDRGGRVVWRDLTENWRVRVRPESLLDVLRGIE